MDKTPMCNIRCPIAVREVLRKRLHQVNMFRERDLTYSQFLEFLAGLEFDADAIRSFEPKMSRWRGRPRLTEDQKKQAYFAKRSKWPKDPDLPRRDWPDTP